jgi:thiamine pyrophosphate-dependent acetolactate synthase large subunit-like protein
VKWDDEPHDLASVPESFARGLASATSAPPGPVYLCYDADLQEQAIPPGQVVEGIGRYPVPTAPAAGRAQLELLAAALRQARRPAILAGYAGDTPEALEALTRLAETIGAPVVDTGVRFALPTDHPLAASGVDGVLDASDVVLTLDVDDLRGPFGDRLGTGSEPGSVEVLAVGLSQLRLRGWSHDYQPLAPVSSLVTGAADETVAALLPLLETEPPDRDAVQARLVTTTETVRAARAEQRRTASRAEAEGAVPLERLVHEVGVALEGRDFVLASGTNRRLEHTLWSMSKARQYIGWHGGGGLGYGLGAAIGAALARPGTISVDIQPDGDLLYLPSALWTAAHLGLPVLIVVHNNRQYANSVEHAAAIAADRRRDPGRGSVGTRLDDPPVDFGALAAAYGVWSAGPIAEPATLAARLADAVAIVAAGRPALLDVLVPGS